MSGWESELFHPAIRRASSHTSFWPTSVLDVCGFSLEEKRQEESSLGNSVNGKIFMSSSSSNSEIKFEGKVEIFMGSEML